ncbi:hypothetical protein EPA93_38080 [Ktedonosporobacter rubrisoli]|uniref:Uncharacterized protein n=1 Tax=Ktedonosporobacter rubrisoli TaxID=2509675 RepID=A0A4P6K1C7_KTERU|nr:hypothetical protein [Ktedonosporobacter rubrisoli]QBD81470.1 hypothetical protein EPA93_38080 [Ktedonosporobacter rubrisoli]
MPDFMAKNHVNRANLALKQPLLRIKLKRYSLPATRFALQTQEAKMLVRMVEYRGRVSTAMI